MDVTSLKKIESQLEWGKENLESPYDNLDEDDIKWLVERAKECEKIEQENSKLKWMIEEGIGFEDLYNPDDEIHPQSR